jgi:hypothetical protein
VGVETSRSSVARPTVAKKRRRRLRQEPRSILLARNCRKRHRRLWKQPHCPRLSRPLVASYGLRASAPTCLYFWFSWCPTLTQVGSPYPDKVGGKNQWLERWFLNPSRPREDLSLRLSARGPAEAKVRVDYTAKWIRFPVGWPTARAVPYAVSGLSRQCPRVPRRA